MKDLRLMFTLGHRKNIGEPNYVHEPQMKFRKQGFVFFLTVLLKQRLLHEYKQLSTIRIRKPLTIYGPTINFFCFVETGSYYAAWNSLA